MFIKRNRFNEIVDNLTKNLKSKKDSIIKTVSIKFFH